nr:hypothetical protein [Iodidimonas gelatinilytica]
MFEDVHKAFILECKTQDRKHTLFNLCTLDTPRVRAVPRLFGIHAIDVVLVLLRIAAATFGTMNESLQKRFGPPLAMSWPVGMLCFSGLCLCPGFVINDAEVWNCFDYPFALWIGARNTLAGFRVFYHTHAIIDEFANIKPVMQETHAALAIAVDGTRSPDAALG